MAYPAELCGCVEDERWEGLPKVSAASDYRNASDVCRVEKIGGGGTLFSEGGHYSPVNYVRGDILWGDSVHYDTGV